MDQDLQQSFADSVLSLLREIPQYRADVEIRAAVQNNCYFISRWGTCRLQKRLGHAIGGKQVIFRLMQVMKDAI